jgi:farnesol dehydrogenase
MKKVLLTGGSGFIGLHLVKILLDQGYRVNALYRNSENLESIKNENLSLFKGSLESKKDIKRAAIGCDFIIHLAGVAKQWAKDPELFNRVNIGGSKNLFDIALELGIKRVVNTSTAGTIPPSTDQPSNESTPREIDYFFEYEASKAAVEKIALDYCDKGLEIITVNPCRVYGPGEIGESNSTVLMMDKYLKGNWKFIPGSGEQYGSFVFVEDVAKGMILALEKGKTGQRYILGGENANYNQFFAIIDKVAGVHFKIYHIPLGLIAFVAKVFGFLANTFGLKPLIMPGVARKLFYNWKASSEKAERELGYQFRSLEQGVSDTYSWLQTRN